MSISNDSENVISPDSFYNRINALIEQHLDDIEYGSKPASLEDLLRLKAAAEKDQPVAMFFLIVLNRQLAFLQDTITDEKQYIVISSFLQAFQQAVEADLLTMMSSLKDGLIVNLGPKGNR